MSFPLDKILNIGLDDYLKTRAKTGSEYEMRGVHLSKFYWRGDYYESSSRVPIKEDFAERVPEGTEVVVNFRDNAAEVGAEVDKDSDGLGYYVRYSANGVALIPHQPQTPR